MKTKPAFVLITFLSMLATALGAYAQDARTSKIRALYEASNASVAESDANGPESNVYLFEYVLNKNAGQYPAVGEFRETARFYYTFGNREKNPYPDRLLRIIVDSRRSDRRTRDDFLFDEKGALVFYYGLSENGAETRVYFENARVFKALVGEVPLAPQFTTKVGRDVSARAARLKAVFNQALVG